MLIYPAIDLIDGCCVRLVHGDFNKVTQYGDPQEQITAFAAAGAQWVHVVDLDGAKAGARRQSKLIAALAAAASVNIQCGGGVRAAEDVEALLNCGIARVVVGSTAVKNPKEVNEWINAFGAERICCAFDVRPDGKGGYRAATDGWLKEGGVKLEALLEAYPAGGLRHVLVTDISRDGALSGANFDLMRNILDMRPDLALQASGGVSVLEDLDALKASGVAGAIVGRAVYEKKFTLEAALGR